MDPATGGPARGGTVVTLRGRYLQTYGTAGVLCSFGDGTADAAPLGGPARTLVPGAGNGSLPWHTPATVLNGSYVMQVAAVTALPNATFRTSAWVTLNGQLQDITQSMMEFEYYGVDALTVRKLYPIAGPKKGGIEVTVHGTGFKDLGAEPHGTAWGFIGIHCIFKMESLGIYMPPVAAFVKWPMGHHMARRALGDSEGVRAGRPRQRAARLGRLPAASA